MSKNRKILYDSNLLFWLFLFAAFLLGTVLRLYLITDQIILDDEWHGLGYVLGRSFFYLSTHSGYGATSIPLNLYRWLLLETFGWTENLLRLPALVAGILSLPVFVFLVDKILSRRATITFAFLMAISPFLIFYSRVSRPYSIYAFLSFVAIISLYLWALDGKRRYAVIFTVASALAVYFNYLAAIAVFTPLAVVFIFKLVNRSSAAFGEENKIIPGLKALVMAGIISACLAVVLILPSMILSPAWNRT